MDQVEGFRLYLSVAEGDELKLAGAPRRVQSTFVGGVKSLPITYKVAD